MNLFYHDTTSFVDDNSTEFKPIEPGQYPAMIVEAGEKTSLTTGSTYAYVKIEIVDGAYKGRKIFDNMFRNSTNEKAVTIAKKKLHAICTSLGIVELKDPNAMLYKPLNINVALDRQDPSKNIVMGYGAREQTSSPSMTAVRKTTVNDIPF